MQELMSICVHLASEVNDVMHVASHNVAISETWMYFANF